MWRKRRDSTPLTQAQTNAMYHEYKQHAFKRLVDDVERMNNRALTPWQMDVYWKGWWGK